MVTVAGVDGCRSGWCYFQLRGKHCEFGLTADLGELVTRLPARARLFVDIPIGLRGSCTRPRACDVEARRLLGPRRSSVFPAPSRAALGARTYEEGSRRNHHHTGRRLSKETWAIVPKIRQVDELLRASPRARRIVREVHPELCFWALAGGRPMAHHKATQAGFEERLAVLSRHYPDAESAVARAFLWHARNAVARDDVMDALVVAVTAAFPESKLRTLPTTPERDDEGIAMRMVYPQPA